MRNHLRILLAVSILAAGQLQGRQDRQICGTTRDNWKEALHLHRRSLDRRAPGLRPLSISEHGAQAAAGRDIGDIAVIEDTDGVVARRNEFNLDRRTLTFWPATARAERYRFGLGENSYDAAAATAGARVDGLGDDDTRMFALPFTFPFFGGAYQSVWINSDGNLTFTAADGATNARSLGRLTAGPPRIAAMFRDLDPSVAGGVRVFSAPDRFVVTWAEVPDYRDRGIGPLQTFQVRLFPEGRIEFAYAGVSNDNGVVGIAPGRLAGPSAVVSFLDGSNQEFSAAVAERFGGTNEVDMVTVAQKFLETHQDAYDYLVVFNALSIPALEGAVAYELTVRSRTDGIGDEIKDVGREFGSPGRLQAVVNMGPLDQYPRDPTAVVPLRLASRDTTLSILGHEVGHLFLAYASTRDPQFPAARPLLGRDGAHWNFVFDSEASLLEGNRIRDDGPGALPRFITIGNSEGYSPLDQYLMGLRAPEEVEPVFVVSNAGIATDRPPQRDVSFNGQRVDVTVQDVIAAEGRRTPDHTVTQRRFRIGFVLIAPRGAEPSAEALAQVEDIRRQFQPYFRLATSARAEADTTLRRSLRVSTFPAAGLVQGGSIEASVGLQQPAEAPLTVSLRAPNGFATVPASVTIPAGATQAAFRITGARAGVEVLAAEPADTRYETVVSRVQVSASAAGLKLTVASGDKQLGTAGTPLAEPVVLRVVDANNVPYPGFRVQTSVSAGGTVTPAFAATDDTGTVTFRWTPGAGPLNELTATLEGGGAVTVTALGRPAVSQGGVVNAASFQPSLAPGALASIFGANLAAGARSSSSFPWPTRMAGVQVTLNGEAVPLVMVSDRQVNFLVPASAALGNAELVVRTAIGASAPAAVPLAAVSPGLFFDPATNLGAVLARGEFLEIYATGLGAVRRSGVLDETELSPRVTIAGLNAEVTFSGLAPGFLGLYQVNVRVPSGVPPGAQPLVLEIGGRRSNEVRVRVQ